MTTHTPTPCTCYAERLIGELKSTIFYCPLHAAAPDLLAALKRCEIKLDFLASRDNIPPYVEREAARTAIAKAEGVL